MAAAPQVHVHDVASTSYKTLKATGLPVQGIIKMLLKNKTDESIITIPFVPNKIYAKGDAWTPARFWNYRKPENLSEEISLIKDGWVLTTWNTSYINWS